MLHTEVFLNLGLSFLTVILVFGTYLWQNARKCHTIPGNLGFPIIGNAYQCLKNYWHTTYSDFYHYMNKHADKYGDIACFWHCHKIAITVADPEFVEKIQEHPYLINKPLFTFERMQYFLKGIFSLDKTDEMWKLRRKDMVSRMKKTNLEDFRSIFIRSSKKAVKLFSEKKNVFNVKPDVTLLFLENICGTHFGIDVDMTGEIPLYEQINLTGILNVNNMINPITGHLTTLLSRLFYPKAQQKFENMLIKETKYRAIEYLKVGSGQPTNFATAIAVRNLLNKTNDEDLARELKELLYVSTHTMSYSGTAGLIFLATNPDVQERIWQEQIDILGDSDRDPTYEDIKRMEYLDRFFKELLRFIGPPMVVREASGPVDFGGKIVPKGAAVYVNFQRLKFDPRYWENPMKFNPDRFLEANVAKSLKGIYSPFGFGFRNCPGTVYAGLLTKVFFSTIVRNLKIHTSTKFEDLMFDENIVRDIKGECNISVEKRMRRMSVSQ